MQGALIFPDLRSVLLDPEHWETPEKFNPNHFLDKDGNFVAREDFLAFGAGKCRNPDLLVIYRHIY